MKGKLVRARLLRVVLLLGVLVLGSMTALVIAVSLVPLPQDLLRPQDGTITLVDCGGRKLASLASTEARAQYPAQLHEMGSLPSVTVALEDARFYSHPGIDVLATGAALIRNVRAGRIVSGASTITQQLIKLSSGRTKRSWTSKIYESLAALHLECLWTKDRILDEYLNRSHYGNRQVGPVAAARAYFNKKPENLTLAETIFLAGLPQAPTRFNPWSQSGPAADRYRRSVEQLMRSRFPKTAGEGIPRSTPALAPRRIEQRIAPHFVDSVLKAHTNLRGGVVTTTLDLDLQRLAEKELELQLEQLAARRVRQGAIVILDSRNGAVRAMVGSRNYFMPHDGQINGATIYRSCGSTLKPFLYLRAIEERIVPAATLLPDTPDAVRAEYIDYDPVNYDRQFLGPVRVREALANSLNVPAVVTLSKVGARKAFLALQDCGLKFARPFSDYGAGLILGNAEVRLLDMTAAFTLFSGANLSVEPHLLAGNIARHRSFASPEAISIIADILADNDARSHTFGCFSPLAFDNERIPCKTGTSSGFRDAWAVGTTAQHAIGVWMGNFDGQPMDEIASIAGPAPVWRSIVDYLLQHGDSSVPRPVETPRLKRKEICALTGMLPGSVSPSVINEWFLPGTEPIEKANRYWKVVNGQMRFVLPPEYALWCRSGQNRLGAKVDDTAPLRIVSPHPDATFVIDPQLLRPQQAVQLIASADPAEKLIWRVDGEAVEPSRNGYFWSLIEGQHTVEVFGSSGHATGKFNVE